MLKKRAFLLIEVIIVLFILSIVVMPWYGFITALQKDDSVNRLNNYFLTKEMFFKAYNNQLSEGYHFAYEKQFLVIKQAGVWSVQRISDGSIKEEIKGKAR